MGRGGADIPAVDFEWDLPELKSLTLGDLLLLKAMKNLCCGRVLMRNVRRWFDEILSSVPVT
jgi:hypothetical protein